MQRHLLIRFNLFCSFLALSFTSVSGQPSTATPSYYFNRETAFLINYAIDPVNGGIYMATNENGALVDISGLAIWNGTAPSGTMSSVKTTSAQAIAILYFIREYHRALEKGVTDINALVTNPFNHLTNAQTLLTVWAKNVADYSVIGDKFKIPASTQSTLGGNANKLFYYGKIDANGTNGTLDGTAGAGNPESLLPWALAELALTMKDAGISSTVYQPYIDEAIEWWNWRKNIATATPFGWGVNSNYGAGRDVYYGPLGLTMAELTGTAEYKTGPGIMVDGKPLGALPFMHNALGAAGNNPDLGNPPANSVQDGAYVAGFARAVTYAKLEQRSALGYTSNYPERQPFQEFGFAPLYERGNSYPVYDINTPSELIALGESPAVAFQHFKGRELFAGVTRTAWHFFSFGVNGGAFYAANGSNPNWPLDFSEETLKTVSKDYWDYCLTTFWDNTTGVAAWLENTGAPKYKPCFSGGVDVPIGDWRSPTIDTCLHAYTPGSPVQVSILGVVDSNWQYLSYKLDNSQISDVDIVYSSDNGATWTNVTASLVSGNNYSATIPESAVLTAIGSGFDFLYYVRARDLFGNYEVCPAGAQLVLPETGVTTAAGTPTQRFPAMAARIQGPCAITVISATPSTCAPAINTYSLDVVVTYSGAPTGNIDITTSNGASISVAQTGSPQTITITGLTSDGVQNIDVTAVFAADAACTHTFSSYNAPVNCACPTVLPTELCPGDTYTLDAGLGLTSIQWFSNGNPISGANSQTYIVSQPGTYYFEALSSGCPASGCCPVVFIAGTCAPACPPNVCLPVTITRN